MKITLYNNKSEVNAINKNLFYIGDLVGDLKQATSLLNPSILIEMNNGELIYDVDVVDANNDELMYLDDSDEIDISVNINYTIFDANYCYIHEFKRYYFIDNIIIQNNKLFMLQLNVDVLESFKEQFMPLDAFITRNEFTYNNYVKDDLITYYYDKDVEEYILPKGDKVDTTFRTDLTNIDSNIVLSVINNQVDYDYYGAIPPVDSLPMVRSTMMSSKATYRIYSTYLSEIKTLSLALQDNDNIKDFILSCIVYPFIPKSTRSTNLILGKDIVIYWKKYMPNYVEVNILEKEIPEYLTIADFTLTASSFLDYEPYTQYEIYLPYLSWVKLNADDILNNRIIVYYVVDYSSGSSQVNIYDMTNDKIIYTNTTQIGVKLGLTTTTQKEVNDLHASNNIGLGVGLMTSALSIIGGAVTMNPVAVGGGALALGSTITKYTHNENTNYLHASGQVSSGLTGLYMCQDVKIRKTKLKPKNYNEDYAKLYGKPLNEYKKLNEVTGFTMVSDIHLENVNATQTELTSIENSLKNGVIIK